MNTIRSWNYGGVDVVEEFRCPLCRLIPMMSEKEAHVLPLFHTTQYSLLEIIQLRDFFNRQLYDAIARRLGSSKMIQEQYRQLAVTTRVIRNFSMYGCFCPTGRIQLRL